MLNLTTEVGPILQKVIIGLQEAIPIHIQAGEELETPIKIGVVLELGSHQIALSNNIIGVIDNHPRGH